MKCNICGLRESVIHIHQIIGNKKRKLHICDLCAEEKGIANIGEGMEYNIAALFAGFFESERKTSKRKEDIVCPGCGMTYNEFNQENRAGCNSCFALFSKMIRFKLKKLTDLSPYKGKLPEKLHSYRVLFVDVEKLKTKLKAALQVEDYESAAVLRDQISKLKNFGVEKWK